MQVKSFCACFSDASYELEAHALMASSNALLRLTLLFAAVLLKSLYRFSLTFRRWTLMVIFGIMVDLVDIGYILFYILLFL